MINSIQYILKKRNRLQQRLPMRASDKDIPEARKKTYISRWVLGERKIPDVLIEMWAISLNVDKKYIANEKGYSRKLMESEIEELDLHIKERPIPDVCEELKNSPQIIRLERIDNISSGIKRLKKSIEKGVYTINESADVDSLECALDIQEYNLFFYETIVRLHQSNKIKSDEWSAILKALAYLKDDTPYNEVSEGFSREIYDVIVKHREEVKKKQKEEIETYKNIFGDII